MNENVGNCIKNGEGCIKSMALRNKLPKYTETENKNPILIPADWHEKTIVKYTSIQSV